MTGSSEAQHSAHLGAWVGPADSMSWPVRWIGLPKATTAATRGASEAGIAVPEPRLVLMPTAMSVTPAPWEYPPISPFATGRPAE